jgi:transposase-like protein
MVHRLVVCPSWHGKQVGKRGKTDTGTQRYRCQHAQGSHQSFLLDPADKGRLPEIKRQIIEMSLKGKGVRDTARVLQISTATVMQELKKRASPHVGKYPLGKYLTPQRRGSGHPAGGGR